MRKASRYGICMGKILLHLILALVLPKAAAADPEDPELAAMRNLAESLLKHKALGPDGAYCETLNMSPTNVCSGMKGSTSRYRVRHDGTVSVFAYRSWREGSEPFLGEFRGSFPPEKWREMLDKIQGMRRVMEEGMSGMPGPPPLPTQNIEVLTLSDGTREASYSTAGPDPMPIREGMNAPSSLSSMARDTIWALKIEDPKITGIKNGLILEAFWNLRGKTPVLLEWPDTSDTHGCGGATLQWHSGESGSGRSGTLNAGKDARTGSRWKLEPGKTVRFRLRFPAESLPRGQKVGKLREFGVLAKPAGGKDWIPLAFFTDRIKF